MAEKENITEKGKKTKKGSADIQLDLHDLEKPAGAGNPFRDTDLAPSWRSTPN